jgi:hypothetical protein
MSVHRLSGLVIVAAIVFAPLAWAQSTAINGTIEGTLKDTTGALLPGVTVTITNVDTGVQRTVTTDPVGSYRAPLLALGRYRVRAELSGFKIVEQTGISLSAGETAIVNLTLEVGTVQEVVSVVAETPIADPGKIDLGRTISDAEVHNLPNVSRNPYNFAFLQANVTGYENEEFGVPRINANGTQMHTNYQIDGNTNTQKDRAGLRLLPSSEIMVREVKVITSGFAPEFGQTTGMVFNAVTPSGTNTLTGSASYRFRRQDFSSRPFFLSPTAPKPDTHVNNYTATVGGPIIKDRWHFYAGYERVERDLSADRVITVKPEDATRLGLGSSAIPASGVIPASQTVNFFLGKTDYEINANQRLSARYFFFKNSSPYNIGGGLNTVERATDFSDRMDSASMQLISTLGPSRLNELRVQFARRHQSRVFSADAASTGPAITVSGVANFGPGIDGSQNAGFDFSQKIWQVIDNFTVIKGRHSLKVGADLQFVDDTRLNTLRQIYTFATIDAYLAARDGITPFSYSTYVQDVGNPAVAYNSGVYGFFVQDDFQVSPSFKVLYGIRYDLFDIPSSRPYPPNPLSQSFKVDKNNFAPRAGFAWTLDQAGRTVLRASTGIMYEPPLLNFYEDAIQRNGDPRLLSVTLNPTSVGAPAFPGGISSATPPQQSIVAMAADFSSQYTWLTNVQIERALSTDLSVAVGYVNSLGRSMPVLVDTNLIPTGQTLADGRPIYSTAVNSSTRVDPTFNHVDTFSSIGEGTYNALTVTVNKRMSHGYLLQATYTLAKGQDDAPLTGTYVVGSNDDRISIPTDLNYDKGVTIFNQTHTFVLSALIAPQVSGTGLGPAILNNNQLGFILQWNSGLPFNIRSNRDLNQDGVQNDRPLDIERNTGRLGHVFNVDARYSRFVPIGARVKLELFGEAKNLFNTGCSDSASYATCNTNVSGVNRIVSVDPAGNLLSPLPDPFPGTSGYQQRQFQLGAKLIF